MFKLCIIISAISGLLLYDLLEHLITFGSYIQYRLKLVGIRVFYASSQTRKMTCF